MKYLSIIKQLSWATLLTLGVGFLTGCQGKENKAGTEVKEEAKIVSLATVKSENKQLNISYTSLLEPKTRNNITAQSGGRLIKLFVEVGSKVRKGQVLARLDDTALEGAKIRLQEAKRNHQRLDELYKLGAIAKVQWEQAKSNYDIALKQERNLATNTLLRSPITGVITAKNYDEGDLSSPQRPVLVVEELAQIKAIINVSEQYYAQLKEGLQAELMVDALANETFEAKISKIYPTVNPRTHTIKVELLVANKGNKLRTGMFARLQLNLGTREVLLVSDAAIHKVMGSGSRYVYVLDGNGKTKTAKFQEVKLGELFGSTYEVLDGLKEGQSVIISAINNLADGDEVIIE